MSLIWPRAGNSSCYKLWHFADYSTQAATRLIAPRDSLFLQHASAEGVSRPAPVLCQDSRLSDTSRPQNLASVPSNICNRPETSAVLRSFQVGSHRRETYDIINSMRLCPCHPSDRAMQLDRQQLTQRLDIRFQAPVLARSDTSQQIMHPSEPSYRICQLGELPHGHHSRI